MRQSHAPLWVGTIAALAIAGCATADSPDPSLVAGDVLVPIPRDVDAQAIAMRDAALQTCNLASSADRNEDFYLAIRRNPGSQRDEHADADRIERGSGSPPEAARGRALRLVLHPATGRAPEIRASVTARCHGSRSWSPTPRRG